MKTLYVSYFGALKHLSQTQILPYLRGLAGHGIGVTFLSFEEELDDPREERRQREALRKELQSAEIEWVPLRYHKWPSLPATAYDVVVGTLVATYLVARRGIDVIHARNHVPAVIGLLVQALLGRKLVFDMRGVMAEEYEEAGVWKKGSLPYRAVKWVEARVLRRADAIVMLTHRILETLRETSKELRSNSALVEVIPCCVDIRLYRSVDRSAARARLGLGDKTVMTYAGSLGGWSMISELVEFFVVARVAFPCLHLLVLTQSRFELVRRELELRGVEPRQYTVRTVPPMSMPEHLVAADFGASFIRPGYSKRSSSPTKIGEYLASGLPVVTSAGIGDIDELIQTEGVGALVSGFSERDYRAAADRMAALLRDGEATRVRCRHVAEKHFSLEKVGWLGYLRVYRSLKEGKS
jgi:glycosyltransferase involved in cell wall biosynthesis